MRKYYILSVLLLMLVVSGCSFVSLSSTIQESSSTVSTRSASIQKYIERRKKQLEEGVQKGDAGQYYITFSFHRYLCEDEIIAFTKKYNLELVSLIYYVGGEQGAQSAENGSDARTKIDLLKQDLKAEFPKRSVEHLAPILDKEGLYSAIIRVKTDLPTVKRAWDDFPDIIRLAESSVQKETLGMGISPEDGTSLSHIPKSKGVDSRLLK